MAYPVLVGALSLTGLVISLYIWYKQVTTGPVLCIGRGCATVIRSRYGRLLGVPNGLWGTIYFGGLVGAAVAGAVFPEAAPALARAAAFASSIALAFFAYLAYLQFAILKALCNWCLASAALTLAVFLLLLAP